LKIGREADNFLPYKKIKVLRNVTQRLGQKATEMGTRFIRWNVRSLYRPGLLMAVSTELTKNLFDLLEAQGGGWDRGGTERAEHFTYFCGKGKSSISVRIYCTNIRETYQQLEE
jgi:hypothetical protein